ncbi:hypothetical protein DICVIV_08846 [Dictyocaulus viviparus]|uniref:Tuberin N-terminal domain-containing protein n=1 Tax=Dictyocaulus viviparus TaxID=29172 RepID=A0A0D8XKP4_DICVI|nr:hypothetical protein DICVIV_08846 [Dictyocaulus viviparus]
MTSKGKHTSAASSLALECSLGRECHIGRPSSPSTSYPTQGSASPARRGGLMTRIFGSSKDKDVARILNPLVTLEGSVTQSAWAGISRSSPIKTRIKTLMQLQDSFVVLLGPTFSVLSLCFEFQRDVFSASFTFTALCVMFWNGRSSTILQCKQTCSFVGRRAVLRKMICDCFRHSKVLRSRTLQVSSLEGIWHDSCDMLSVSDTKIPTLKVLVEMTETQYGQLGLALRHTFFKTIEEIGCEELSVKWLNVLSENGKTITGFEKDMDVLVANWISQTLLIKEHPQASLVLQLAQSLIQHNAPFIGDHAMKHIVHTVCVRACKAVDALTAHCLDVLDNVLKYSDLPRSELMSVVTTFCVLVCENKFREQAWLLARSLLTSQMGHRTRKALLSILNGVRVQPYGEKRVNDDLNEKKLKRMLRGAIFCLANANWGTTIDTIRCSPGSIIEPMRNAIQIDEMICFVRDINIGSTTAGVDQRFEYAKTCENSLHQILLLTEQLYSDGQFAAPPDLLYDLIEKCADRRPDTSVVKLIQYRSMTLDEEQPRNKEKVKANMGMLTN